MDNETIRVAVGRGGGGGVGLGVYINIHQNNYVYLFFKSVVVITLSRPLSTYIEWHARKCF